MATFRVGQKVRVISVCRPWNRHLIGREGVITQFALGRCILDWEPQTGAYPYWGFDPENLAPAYDGYEKVEWETCAWQPNREGVVA